MGSFNAGPGWRRSRAEQALHWIARMLDGCRNAIALLLAGVLLAACGTSTVGNPAETPAQSETAAAVHKAKPQVIEPSAGVQAQTFATTDPVGDPTAHARPLSEVRQQLRLEVIYAPANNATYINPLRYVNHWERTDQGVDATMPVGAPILAPCRIKILDVEPNWYAGQPLVYYELLEGPDAGSVQYVAEEITKIARPGLILQAGQAIAHFAASGTGIEFGWSTLNGVTLARATTGYEEGQVTPAGRSIRRWLNALGANAGPS
jgi:hypothetical protein